ncbi:hypothetical protein GH714_031531 [Hevea brasiliensis]|uniref:Uncharacterized protein n=1 Tax=Hevea brasiliensis TaxID=3981 RepID=A0A6A6NBQ2_HEVBR|nr:hypothetical protein GH714_031531 [Hevea brasiliensis]
MRIRSSFFLFAFSFINSKTYCFLKVQEELGLNHFEGCKHFFRFFKLRFFNGVEFRDNRTWVFVPPLEVMVQDLTCAWTSEHRKNIVNGPSSDILHRNIRYSPTWSFRWDNRGRVAGEETSITWFSDANSRNDGPDIKYESAYASEDGSPLDSFRRRAWQKSPTSEATTAHVRTPASDQSMSRIISMDTSLEQVKESMESQTVSHPYPAKLSVSLPSTSSITSPASSQSHPHPASSTPKLAREFFCASVNGASS